MFGKHTYSVKIKLLTAAFVIAGLIVYYFSLQPTAELVSEYLHNQELIQKLTEQQQSQLLALDPILSDNKEGIASVESREELTALLAQIAETSSCEIVDIPNKTSDRKDTTADKQDIFIMRGTFKDLVQALDKFETKSYRSFLVMTSRFYTTENPLLREKELLLLIKTRTYGG